MSAVRTDLVRAVLDTVDKIRAEGGECTPKNIARISGVGLATVIKAINEQFPRLVLIKETSNENH